MISTLANMYIPHAVCNNIFPSSKRVNDIFTSKKRASAQNQPNTTKRVNASLLLKSLCSHSTCLQSTNTLHSHSNLQILEVLMASLLLKSLFPHSTCIRSTNTLNSHLNLELLEVANHILTSKESVPTLNVPTKYEHTQIHFQIYKFLK